MKVQVLAFAGASDIVGREPQTRELADGARLSDLKTLLTEQHPELEKLWGRLAVAVSGRLETGDPVLEDGVEVALLPPVSGGAPEPTTRARRP